MYDATYPLLTTERPPRRKYNERFTLFCATDTYFRWKTFSSEMKNYILCRAIKLPQRSDNPPGEQNRANENYARLSPFAFVCSNCFVVICPLGHCVYFNAKENISFCVCFGRCQFYAATSPCAWARWVVMRFSIHDFSYVTFFFFFFLSTGDAYYISFLL